MYLGSFGRLINGSSAIAAASPKSAYWP